MWDEAVALTNCHGCGRKTTFTEVKDRYDKTEWMKCDSCGQLHFRIGSSYGY